MFRLGIYLLSFYSFLEVEISLKFKFFNFNLCVFFLLSQVFDVDLRCEVYSRVFINIYI